MRSYTGGGDGERPFGTEIQSDVSGSYRSGISAWSSDGCAISLCSDSVPGSGYRVQGTAFRVQGSGYRVQGTGFRVQGTGFRVQGLEDRVEK